MEAPEEQKGERVAPACNGKNAPFDPGVRSWERVHYSSPLPYTALHNEGGKFAQNVRTHTRTNRRTGKTYTVRSHTRQITMPKRQFIGDHKEVRQAIKQIVHENITEFFDNLAKELRK